MSLRLNEGQGHWKWNQTIQSNGNYHSFKSERKQFKNIQTQASIAKFSSYQMGLPSIIKHHITLNNFEFQQTNHCTDPITQRTWQDSHQTTVL